MSNQFMKKCSECGAFGAAYQTTNEQGEPIQLCHECRKKALEKPDSAEQEEKE